MAPYGAYRQDPSALPTEKQLPSEIPGPCRAKMTPGDAALGGLQARFLRPAERKGAQESDSWALARPGGLAS